MGKPTGFQEWPRASAPKRAPEERVGDSRELALPLAPGEARRQAGRCMDCGIPFCHQGCPLGNRIPDFNELVWRERWEAAFHVLASTNNFPEFTGRLCPAPCEAACVLAIGHAPVAIEQLEKEIIERAFAEGWVKPRPPERRSGASVAIVGSGPAGLAAAAQLNRAGHTVTVYERADAPGGLLRYGIPDFKLERAVLDRRLALLEAEGVRFRTGVDVGGGLGFDALRAEHDALVLALGARRARQLEVPGYALEGVLQALDFLEAHNRHVAGGSRPDARLDVAGKRVIVLGGGDTGSDCLGTALRQGALEVTQVELLPAPPEQRSAPNPWPQWPVVFRTSSSQEEGGVREFGLRTRALEGEHGRLRALRAAPVALQEGRLRDVEEAPELVLPVDVLVLALGFVGADASAAATQLGLELTPAGNVRVGPDFATRVPGVFAAGDASRGASLVVWAIADGREAARSVDTYLTKRPSRLPTRGAHLPFGGR